MEETILAIDNGTQSVRAMLFDVKGNLVHKAKVDIEPYFSTQPGWAEQQPEYYWENISKACHKLWKMCGNEKEGIKGVVVTAQRNTLINLDKSGKPLRPAIHWLDQRRIERQRVVNPLLNIVFKLVKMDFAVEFAYSECESNWIRKMQPEIWDRTYKYMFLSGYINYMLTGEYVDSVGNQVGYIPFDYKKFRWANKGHLNRKIFPMEMDKLPRLVKQGRQLGQISRRASDATGIPEGLPVYAGAADKACEILGAGAITPDIACLSYGTTCTTSVLTRKYVEVIPFIPPYPSALPDTYNTEIQIFRGYWMVSWFKNEFGHPELEEAQKNNVVPEALLDELIKNIPPGSMGLMLQPYWAPGVKVPGPEAKGAIIGFGDVHTRAHVYRSILEGLAYALREGTGKTEKRTGVKIHQVRVSGGGSQSDVAMQITADIFNRPAIRPRVFETSGLGAAIDAAVGLGWFTDFESAVHEMTRIGEIFEPNHKYRDIYEQLYQRVYKKMYRNLQNLYKEIKDITGYPQYN